MSTEEQNLEHNPNAAHAADDTSSKNWTRGLRDWLINNIPMENLLPDSLPTYVHSYVYLFGILTLASFLWLIITGTVLAVFGPDWWHVSAIGHFFNSMHFWSVQAFFFFMVLHLWAQFLMASWRGGRHWTWVGGWVLFLISIVAGLTGYLSQNNFDSQWIGLQGKDAINSTGVGGFFNLLNFGQMYGLHIFVLPLILIVFIMGHLFLVRKHGVVEPFEDEYDPALHPEADSNPGTGSDSIDAAGTSNASESGDTESTGTMSQKGDGHSAGN